jgi:glyoxylase-like metal-dependent hydrolase (beta-lactamase superfamily II)
MGQLKTSFKFKIGDIDGLVIKDSCIPSDEAKLFPNLTKNEAHRLLERYHLYPLQPMDVSCLLIKTRENSILIDTGWGVDRSTNSSTLIKELLRNGIELESIDTIILTHAHGDHIGGITDNFANPIFRNARYIMCRKEWAFWMSNPDLGGLEDNIRELAMEAVRKNLILLAQRYDLVDDEVEVRAGVKVVMMPGHSPGHATVLISADSDKLVCTGDVVHHPLQIARPDINTDFDFEPGRARLSRERFVREYASDHSLVFACHFPFPGLGHIKTKDKLLFWSSIII